MTHDSRSQLASFFLCVVLAYRTLEFFFFESISFLVEMLLSFPSSREIPFGFMKCLSLPTISPVPSRYYRKLIIGDCRPVGIFKNQAYRSVSCKKNISLTVPPFFCVYRSSLIMLDCRSAIRNLDFLPSSPFARIVANSSSPLNSSRQYLRCESFFVVSPPCLTRGICCLFTTCFCNLSWFARN